LTAQQEQKMELEQSPEEMNEGKKAETVENKQQETTSPVVKLEGAEAEQ